MKELRAQRGSVICWKSHSWEVATLRFKARCKWLSRAGLSRFLCLYFHSQCGRSPHSICQHLAFRACTQWILLLILCANPMLVLQENKLSQSNRVGRSITCPIGMTGSWSWHRQRAEYQTILDTLKGFLWKLKWRTRDYNGLFRRLHHWLSGWPGQII